MPRFDAGWIDAMIGPARAAATPPEQVLDLVQVGPGDNVADVGCGPGFLTLPAARRVGAAGVVWALDAEPAMTDLVQRRAVEAGLGSAVRPLLVAAASLPLPDGAADVVLCSLLLHFFREPGQSPNALAAFADELRRIASPDARLLVLEWTPRHDPPHGNRIAATECATVLTRAGWRTDPPIPLGSVTRPAGPEAMYALVGRPAGAPAGGSSPWG